MRIIVAIIITLLFLNVAYKKYQNPYKLYMIFGKKGSGKSTYLCKLALFYRKKGYAVYTNMQDMNIDGVRIIKAEDLGRCVPDKRSVVLLDEVGMLYDNRDFKNFKPEVRDFFKLQRHYNCVVYLASQTFDIDKKLRDLTDRMFLVSSLSSYLSLIRPISKKITLVEATSQGESKIAENLRFLFFTSWRFLFIPRYVRYFDSFVAPEKPALEYSPVENKKEKEKTKKFSLRKLRSARSSDM